MRLGVSARAVRALLIHIRCSVSLLPIVVFRSAKEGYYVIIIPFVIALIRIQKSSNFNVVTPPKPRRFIVHSAGAVHSFAHCCGDAVMTVLRLAQSERHNTLVTRMIWR